MRRLFIYSAALSLIAGAPLLAQATDDIITKSVAFPKGSSSSKVADRITGSQIRDYHVNARAGQVMTVRLSNASSSLAFNVMEPGEQYVAIYNGEMDGTQFRDTLKKSGNYTIRVYLNRAAGRRGEASAFTLDIGVTGSSASAATGSKDGSISGIQGMDAVTAIDELSARGFKSVDSFSSGDTLYGIYYYAPTRLCVQTTSADSKILDIRDIKTHPKCK